MIRTSLITIRLLRKLVVFKFEPRDQNVLYLTFDDGPDRDWTIKLLEILEKYNAKATFFLVGERLNENIDITEKIIEKGHITANHSYSHKNRFKMNSQGFKKSVTDFPDEYSNKLYRPPYGKFLLRDLFWLKSSGFKTVLWSINTKDYSKRLITAVRLRRINNSIKNGDIILLHNNPKHQANTELVLISILKNFSKMGFVFKTIEN
jgi:peptidoglycan/xylan/chitin deacetylase (PgdA/CDA1 family)